MAYFELIKSFAKIRGYIREFYVYGFRHRLDIDTKSARSYDNERRRVESWLGEYMHFGQDTDGKRVYLSVDSRNIPANPLYRAFKAKSFTDNDVMLHFYLMDLLPETNGISLREVIDILENEYLTDFCTNTLDESTIRKKLKEYEQLGLVEKNKRGRESIYVKKVDAVRLESWKQAISFFSETAPLGVIGSTLLDKFNHVSDYFRYKHHHIMKALDSEILNTLFEAISSKSTVKMTMLKADRNIEVLPYKILISTQYGRQYLLGWSVIGKQFRTYRLDHILHVKVGKPAISWEHHYLQLEDVSNHMWGASIQDCERTEHVGFKIHVEPYEAFVAERLEREKRCGTVEQLDEVTWKFSADLYQALEILPWVRTFIGRIQQFQCDNPKVEERFYTDIERMLELYDDPVKKAELEEKGDDEHAVS